jgi:hypothetical protein
MEIQTTDKHAYIKRMTYLFTQKAKGQLTSEELNELEVWAGSNDYRKDLYNKLNKATELVIEQKLVPVNTKFKWKKFLFLFVAIGTSGYIGGGIILMLLAVCCFLLGIYWKHDNDYL